MAWPTTGGAFCFCLCSLLFPRLLKTHRSAKSGLSDLPGRTDRGGAGRAPPCILTSRSEFFSQKRKRRGPAAPVVCLAPAFFGSVFFGDFLLRGTRT